MGYILRHNRNNKKLGSEYQKHVVQVRTNKHYSINKKIVDIYNNGEWLNKKCFIIGGGESLIGFDFNILKGQKVISINLAFISYPEATINYSMDPNLYDRIVDNVVEEHKGKLNKKQNIDVKQAGTAPATNDVTRGFCADGETLTHYIMNYLGNGDPYSGLNITTTSLPSGTVGTAYSQSISALGGTIPYTYTLYSGSLPNNLSLSSSGAITGTPTIAGTFNFTIRVTDNVSATDDQALSITIAEAPPAVERNIVHKGIRMKGVNF